MKHALCIGINAYAHGSDLAGCVNDATDWGEALMSRGFGVALLKDHDATKEAILGDITRLMRDAKTGDVVVIQYSGHGTFVPDTSGDEKDGYDEALCPVDLWTAGPLVDDELEAAFAQSRKRIRVVLIADSCHSGTVSRFALDMGGGTERLPKVKFLPPALFSERAAKRAEADPLALTRVVASPPGRRRTLLLAGCQDTEYSFDAFFGDRPNGAFSRAALDTLKDLPTEASYKDWNRAIRKRLPSASYPQAPNLWGTAAQFKWKVLE